MIGAKDIGAKYPLMVEDIVEVLGSLYLGLNLSPINYCSIRRR